MFSPNCTLPSASSGFVTAPSIRGTMNIVYTCAGILIICTWNVLHLNIPTQSTPRHGIQRFMRSALRLLPKIANLVAPELILSKAWSEYLSVRSMQHDFEHYAKIDDVEWTHKHTHLANMGGFTIFFQGGVWSLDAKQLLIARHLGIIDRLPSLSVDAIDDRSKQDFLIKFLSAVQLIQFGAEILTRLLNQRSISQLEVVTLTLALPTLPAYYLWLGKPKDIYTTIDMGVPAAKRPSVGNIRRLAKNGPRVLLPRQLAGPLTPKSSGPTFSLPNYIIHCGNSAGSVEGAEDDGRDGHEIADGDIAVDTERLTVFSSVATTVTGAVHFLAWNSALGNDSLRLLWRVSAVATMVSMPAMLIVFYTATRFSRLNKLILSGQGRSKCIAGFFWAILITGRLLIGVVAFTSMWYLPPDAFTASWTVYVPHLT
ncbi:hypothetical protein L249_0400 [Ophiocordyceps polyrhachis-furcata BCC 54312]|uniref:Uncharacterized protein n=1 Tax=Ophiocordyceps polyrhachis-furcata BCC 54312 TaxID=1330021 RepID=A0A367LFZ1_9HYPO|nr:hypothetical protein L249_0400 [Ophiocordyceps polyrhachis-furcata BCC 54312]